MFEAGRASQKRCREVSFAGMAGDDHVALMLVSHQDIDRREVENVLRRLFPEEPTVAMLAGDAADFRRCRRGLEPLRVVILPQQGRRVTIVPMVTAEQSAASHKRSFSRETHGQIDALSAEWRPMPAAKAHQFSSRLTMNVN